MEVKCGGLQGSTDSSQGSISQGPSMEVCGLPGGAMVNSPATAGDAKATASIPGLGRSPGVEKWQLAPVFLPGKFNGQRILVAYSP